MPEIPHTYNRDTARSHGNDKQYVCTCGKPQVDPIHPHRPIEIHAGRCSCGVPVDAICHRIGRS